MIGEQAVQTTLGAGDTGVSTSSRGGERAVELLKAVKVYRLDGVEVHALRGVDLVIGRGEFVAVIGPSGSGKSTLLNLVGALDRPSTGKVFIDGTDISRLSNSQLADLRNSSLGFVFQSYNLIPRMTVLRNVELPMMVRGVPRAERRRRAGQILSSLGLGDKMGRRPGQLSGGEQQRVAIARALANEPAIVLADEPTGNVDSKTAKGIVSALKRLSRERDVTVVVVTHNPEVASAADRVIYLRDGLIEREVRQEDVQT